MGKLRIGVFDSGIGGLAVAEKLQQAFPDFKVMTVNDSKNVPYGTKSAKEIIRLTDNAIRTLIDQHCNPVILACNTATAVAIEILRAKYPEIQFIGLEPMVKTASKLTKTNTFVMCATPATLNSERYKKLKKIYTQQIKVIEPDCSSWAYMIENNAAESQKINKTITQALNDGADLIVLGCTHYHWIEDYISKIAGKKAMVIEPSAALVRRVSELTGYIPAKDFTDSIN